MATSATFAEWNGSALLPLTASSAPDEIKTLVNLCYCPSFENGISGYAPNGSLSSATVGGTASLSTDITWFEKGARSLKVSAAGSTVTNSSAAYPFAKTDAMARMQVVPGKTYTFAATIRKTHTQTGILYQPRSLNIGVNTGGSDNYTFATSPAAANGPGVERLSTTFTVPSNAVNVWARLMNGEASVANGGSGGSVWWDSVMLCEGTDGTYWDGSTPNNSLYTYEWTGVPHQSTSIRKTRPVDTGGTLTALIV